MIAAAQLDRVVELVARHGIGSGVVDELRRALPGVHFTYCMDDDVSGAAPLRRGAGFNLYLVDGRGHCLRFTDRADRATGLVLAELEPE